MLNQVESQFYKCIAYLLFVSILSTTIIVFENADDRVVKVTKKSSFSKASFFIQAIE